MCNTYTMTATVDELRRLFGANLDRWLGDERKTAYGLARPFDDDLMRMIQR